MLATRVASALVFGPLLLAAGYFGGPLLWLVTATVVALGLWEFDRLLTPTGARAHPGLTLPFGLALVVVAAAGRADLMAPLLTLAVVTSLALPVVRGAEVKAVDGLGAVVAVTYVGWLAAHFILLRSGGAGGAAFDGLKFFLVGLVGTWAFDSGSYFGGRAFGRRKLCPSVSPGKTVAGLVGGVVVGTAAIVSAGLIWLGLAVVGSIVLALVIMAAAQLGDLAESVLKRWSGVKDSGRLIPGHGGILDRFDSLLFVMPSVYYLASLWLGG